MKNLNSNSIAAIFAVFLALGFIGPIAAFAATTPSLGTAITFGVLSNTFTRNTATTTITGDLGYTTLSGSGTHTVSGTTHIADTIYGQAGTAQGIALVNLNNQYAAECTSLGDGAVNLDNVPGHTTGHYTPGCYSSGGAMNITVGGNVTFDGDGTYIFRPNGALTTQANTKIILNGASECDIFWIPTAATTLGANSTFIGTDIDASGITIGDVVTWTGRALAYGGTVTANGTHVITAPTCTNSATLHVIKTLVNNNGGALINKSDFSFSVNGGAAQAFETDGQNDLNVIAGTYTVTEPAVAGYATNYDNCSDLVLGAGDSATCTITNSYVPPQPTMGNIIVKKVTSNGDTTTPFTFVRSGSGYSGFSLTGGGQKDSGSLNAGAYSVAESNLPANWSSDGGDCVSSVGRTPTPTAILLAAGETVTCTFTNTYTAPLANGSIKVIKTAVNGKGTFKFTGNNGIAGFSIATACGGTGSYTIKNLVPGTYAITEDTASLPTGWAKTADTCGTVIVTSGETAVCTVTNTYTAPPLPMGTIKIVKTTVGGNSTNNTFSFVVANSNGKTIGMPAISLSGNSSNSAALRVAAGRYTVQEMSSCGKWNLTSLVCDNGTVAGNKASITVSNNQTVTCTFINTIAKANQTITVKKHAQATMAKGSSFTVSAIASSGLAVAITVSGNCSITGGGSGTATVKMGSGAGICATHYNQAGNGVYNAAPEVVENTAVAKTCRR